MRGPCAALLVLLLGAPPAAADPPLRHDPFQQPGSDGAGVAARGAGWRAELRATLVSGEDSLVDLGGLILRVGQAAHGYRLVEVREREATFERGGARVVLPLLERGDR